MSFLSYIVLKLRPLLELINTIALVYIAFALKKLKK